MSDTSHLSYTQHRYGPHDLQRLGVWRWTNPHPSPNPPPSPPATSSSPSSTSSYWLVYIHGGIWRDPRTTHAQAQATFSLLGDDAAAANRQRLAGFASIDYRLSPHPDFPQDGATTPPNELRQARHPEHLRDVRAALRYLSREFNLGNRAGETQYILYGHSCGATMAMQVVMGLGDETDGGDVPLPAAVVGLQGMYDLVGLNERFQGAYGDMIAGAFGDDREVWRSVSPAHFAGRFSETWAGRSRRSSVLAVLAYSPQDEWIDMAEVDAMEARLKSEGSHAGVHVEALRDLKGGHDEVAEDGRTVTTVLMHTISGLDKLQRLREGG